MHKNKGSVTKYVQFMRFFLARAHFAQIGGIKFVAFLSDSISVYGICTTGGFIFVWVDGNNILL